MSQVYEVGTRESDPGRTDTTPRMREGSRVPPFGNFYSSLLVLVLLRNHVTTGKHFVNVTRSMTRFTNAVLVLLPYSNLGDVEGLLLSDSIGRSSTVSTLR